MEPTAPQPLAIWNSARDVWETPATEGFFCEHLDVFSETFPTSGMTVNGAAYALPTWGGATDDTESSSLLLTPVASEGQKATFQQGSAQRALTGQPFLTNQIRDIYDLNLLPTPTVGMMMGGSATRSGARNGEKLLPGVAKDLALMPTPKASDGEKGGPNQRGSKGDLTMPSVAARIGASTNPPSDAGNTPLDGHLPGQLNLLDAMEDTA